ncbi:cyclodeaminase/cyclohydrolase family protein [Arthrobacter sp. H35-D1]|uniref:cyclodeaminase/cyclohydrolase family protein n=1 Tax=Arthrobacter sp. H35-D1 TaxID=3046202 RepID=UPI0024BAEE2C|nr:cyclodeaminase/cyclohydrolase family protein [Arthrobacter sp. H35-D1]MDJ0313508.1 cyclodeaminase/cyclohydrolase family protein [Arthrobacter sp. H35-D1]
MEATGWASGDYLDRPLRELFEDVASGDSVPAAGSAVAVLGALAAGLTAKVARRSSSGLPSVADLAQRADELREGLEPLVTADAAGYVEALAAPGDRAAAMAAVSAGTAFMAESAAEIAQIAAVLAADGNQNLRWDATAAARIAVVAAEVAAELTAANVGEDDPFPRAHSAAILARTAADRLK